MRAVVGLVTHNRPDLLARTLESLSACERPAAFRGVLVVENGPDDASRAVAERYTGTLAITYRRIDSPTKSDALNEILRLADDELVIFLDDDVRVSSRLLAEYCEAAERFGPGHYFGGPTGADYEEPPEVWLRPFLPLSAQGLALGSEDEAVRYPTCFLGFNWAAFDRDLKACGGYSRRFGPGTPAGAGDESFLQLRLNRRGILGRYLPAAMVWHFVPRERCSPAWALARARCGGFCAGVFEEHRHRFHGLPLSKGRLLLRQLWRKTRSQDVRDLFLGRRRGRYWLRQTARWMAGFREGLSLAAEERPLDDDTWRADGLGDASGADELNADKCLQQVPVRN